ncbi:hypothetical protein FRC07_013761 [Ceratobasidium sp. 392]|nr:hypothetical protein FRC07_013761 [Ceratobasidium sp. 392]
MIRSTPTVAAVVGLVSLASPALAQSYTLSQGGSSGVSAMMLTVATETTVAIFDKLEHNPLHDENDKPAWGSVYSVNSDTARPLHIITNSFCATGTWLSNGTLAQAGGNPLVETSNTTAQNGLQGMRLFNGCPENAKCDVYESPYDSAYIPTLVPILNNPTYEYYPPKNINGYNGLQIRSQFLKDSLPHNMFPHMMLLPSNEVFVAANKKTMLLNWQTNTETRLPDLPNGQTVTYPMSGVGVLLPLTPENNYTPEVMLCGGSELPDTLKENEVSSQSPTSKQCSRMVLNAAGIAAGWKTEQMPEGRVMPDASILPDGKILILNGAKTGTAGWGNVPDQIGLSNADNPAFTPVLYDPTAPAGSRFSSAGMPTSGIARMYHSVSTLLPDGRVLIAGSNPNADVENRPYKTEYQIEYISPPYMTKVRPTYTGLPTTWNYGQVIALAFTAAASINPPVLLCALHDPGFATHGVHMDMRMVKLQCSLSANRKSLSVTGPPNAAVYPPGPAWLYVIANGVPSKATRVLIGNGASPPVDQGAVDKALGDHKSGQLLRIIEGFWHFTSFLDFVHSFLEGIFMDIAVTFAAYAVTLGLADVVDLVSDDLQHGVESQIEAFFGVEEGAGGLDKVGDQHEAFIIAEMATPLTNQAIHSHCPKAPPLPPRPAYHFENQ